MTQGRSNDDDLIKLTLSKSMPPRPVRVGNEIMSKEEYNSRFRNEKSHQPKQIR